MADCGDFNSKVLRCMYRSAKSGSVTRNTICTFLDTNKIIQSIFIYKFNKINEILHYLIYLFEVFDEYEECP